MKIKAIVLVAAAVLAMGTAALAKDKGTLSKFPNWGVITVPDDIYMQSGRQPMLTAADEGNDVIALFERIFPIQPISSMPICCIIRRPSGTSRRPSMGRTGKTLISAISAAGRICASS